MHYSPAVRNTSLIIHPAGRRDEADDARKGDFDRWTARKAGFITGLILSWMTG